MISYQITIKNHDRTYWTVRVSWLGWYRLFALGAVVNLRMPALTVFLPCVRIVAGRVLVEAVYRGGE